MKTGIHPKLNHVVFIDTSSKKEFVTLSTLSSEETKKIDGVDHYVIYVEISSASHPFYTGEKMLVDTAGRVEKFKKRQENALKLQEDYKKAQEKKLSKKKETREEEIRRKAKENAEAKKAEKAKKETKKSASKTKKEDAKASTDDKKPSKKATEKKETSKKEDAKTEEKKKS